MDSLTITTWPDRIIRWGFYLLVILVPLILTPWNYELFEYNKMLVVYGLTAIIMAAWATKMAVTGEIKIAKTPLDIPIALFVFSQLVSTLFSMDPHVSWWGYYSRFNGGMWSIVSYVLLYYAFVSNVKILHISKFLKVTLTTATVVALYGVAERLGIDKNLWVQDVQNRVFSTLGQPNWLAAYLAAITPIALSFGVLKKRGWQLGFALSVLFFLVILFTRSRSGLLGFAVADGLFGLLLFLKSRTRFFYISLTAFHFALLVIVLVNGTHIDAIDKWIMHAPSSVVATPSGTLLETGGTESGTIRKYVWEAAITAWQNTTKTKLIGTGTETFAFAFYQFRPKEHNLTSEWDFLYNKAHHEYLNYLATTGVFVLGSYLLFIGVFIVWFIRVHSSLFTVHGKAKNIALSSLAENSELFTINSALFAGWASILVTNFFGFSVVITNIFLFLLPAIVISSTIEQSNNVTIRIPASWKGLSQGTISALCVIILVILGRDWYADSLYASGYRESHAGQYAAANRDLSQAISLHSTEPTYHDEASSVLASLALAAAESKESTIAAELMKKSLLESDIAISSAPRNVNFWKTRTKVFYSLSSFDPQFNQSAIDALEKARALSPTDPKITYNLAILRGRQAENNAAISLLKETIDLKPNYRDAYWALSLFYTEIKQPDLSRRILEDYLTNVDPTDKEFLQKVGK